MVGGDGCTGTISKNIIPSVSMPCVLVASCGHIWLILMSRHRGRLELIIKQMTASEGMTEDLKATDQMAWVDTMNNIRNRAEEIILRELIYEEVAV